MIQLTVDGVITETGQNVQLNVEEEHKPEPGLVQTQLQLMVVLTVLGRRLKVKLATHNLVRVNIACIYHVYKRVSLLSNIKLSYYYQNLNGVPRKKTFFRRNVASS